MSKPMRVADSAPPRRFPVQVCTVVCLGAALIVAGAGTGHASSTAGRLAPALDGAASGGRVIVVLKNQHSGLNLRTQAARRMAAVRSNQAPIVAGLEAHGARDVTRLVAPDAVAASVPASEVARLRTDPAVAEIVPDVGVAVQQAAPAASAPATAVTGAKVVAKAGAQQSGMGQSRHSSRSRSIPPLATHVIPETCPSQPAQEPEADADIHASNGNPNAPDEANSIATGTGVIVAIAGMNQLAGNPNFTRPDGSHVVIDAPDYTADVGNDESYLDASSVAAQGTVVYQYSKALPYSNVPAGCTFYIEGDAPGASLVDSSQITTPPSPASATQATELESQVIAGIDNAVTTEHADVISESYGGANPRVPTLIYTANDAAVAAGVTVVVSAGDSGDSGTMNPIAADPEVIAAGAVDNFRLVALNDGYSSYVSNNMAALSSGGTAPTNKLVNLVAPGWFGGESACADGSGGCPPNYPTEAARGTSEAAPLVAGAAADVIQAYRDTHNGSSPTPAMIKDILTSTATDIDSPADQQGAGLLDVYAAVKAAQQMPGSTDPQDLGKSPGLIASPSQLDVTGNGGSVSNQTVSLYNTGNRSAVVTGDYRWIGPERQIGPIVTENISAPTAGTPIPPEGAQAATPITFTVPPGIDRLDADMIWPDPTNSNVLQIQLFNPQGALVQESYDDGSPARNQVSNIQHVEVSDPQPGRWTAKVLWSGTDEDPALGPNTPGTYTGPMRFKVSGQDYLTAHATGPMTIPAHASVPVPLHILMPRQPGDHPESVQFSASDGAATSLPVARRTLIPAGGGAFRTLITSSVGRAIGQLSTYAINVPAGRTNLSASFHTADASPDNKFTFYLVNPSGTVVSTASTPQTVNGQPVANAEVSTANPVAGTWQIDVELDLTVSGKEFTQTVYGDVSDP